MPNAKTDKRLFDTPSLVTLATGEDWISRKKGGVYDAAYFLTGQKITSDVPEILEAARQELFRQDERFISLRDNLPQNGYKKGWLKAIEESFGPVYLRPGKRQAPTAKTALGLD